MAFYNPSGSQITRHYHQEVEMVFSALDCALNSEKAIYCSSELTTGMRLYDALREHGLKTSAELKEQKGKAWFDENLWEPNVKAASEFAKAVRSALEGRSMVITPAPFNAPGWSQPEYLAFWETLLRTRIKSAWFNDNWQFSNGCTFEFAVALDAGLPTHDREGGPLDQSTGVEQINKAIHKLNSDGFDTSKLRENLDRLVGVQAQVERKVAERV